ncbi:MAG: hypothetical protein VB142_11415 [Burkholderia sp.]
MNIRDIIGKGSANDINRGKEDFRRAHGDALRKTSSASGQPPSLWCAKRVDGQVAEWQAQIERAEAAVAYAEAERDQAVSRTEALQGQIADLQEAMNTIQGRGRYGTRSTGAGRADVRIQPAGTGRTARRATRAVLAHLQQELSDAITRIEGVEKHSTLEIDRARTEAKNKIAPASK